jgi:hypothetical protein
MKKIAVLLVIIVCTSAFAMFNVKPTHAATVYTVGPGGFFPSVSVALGSLLLMPGDHLHLLPGHFEMLPPGGIIIAVPNLWIIGCPYQMLPHPIIDVGGQTISIAAPGVFISQIEIQDSFASPRAIDFTAAASNCIIQGCKITGNNVVGSVGIGMSNSPANLIYMNAISKWDEGIDVWGPGSVNNIIELNTIDNSWAPSARGVQVGSGAGFNQMFWNNMMSFPCPPGFGQEFWDFPPLPCPPNFFDDSMQVPTWGKGNFESSWAIPVPPYAVLGGINGWMDTTPLAAPIFWITGDIKTDGIVDIYDAIKISNQFNTVWCTTKWDPREDLNGDGIVDIYDAILLAKNYGKHY